MLEVLRATGSLKNCCWGNILWQPWWWKWLSLSHECEPTCISLTSPPLCAHQGEILQPGRRHGQGLVSSNGTKASVPGTSRCPLLQKCLYELLHLLSRVYSGIQNHTSTGREYKRVSSHSRQTVTCLKSLKHAIWAKRNRVWSQEHTWDS